VIICVDHAGVVSNDGDTHQGIFDLAYFNSIPHLTILSPKDGSEAISMLDYAINEVKTPVIIRYSKEKIAKDVVKYQYLPKWMMEGEGSTVVITYGILYQETKKYIKEHDLKVAIVNASILSNLDEELLIKLATDEKKLIVYEEVYRKGSLGDAILRFYNGTNLYPKIKLLAFGETYLEVGTREELLREYKISLDDLRKEIGD
jgi:1-deoxy-D-xylulose-5-phosphate synthase